MNATTPPRGRNVLLCGYYGFGNAGDELILEAIVTGLRARRSDLGVTVVAGDPEGTSRRHGVAVVHWQDVLGIAAAVHATDLVLVGGGGLFQEYWEADLATFLTERHGSMTFYAGPLVLAALSGKAAAVIGVGVGPVVSEAGRRILRAVGEAGSVLSVRDRASRDVLVEAGVSGDLVTVGADAVFGLPLDVAGSSRAAGERAQRLVGVSLRPWSFGVEQERWEAEVAAALDRVLANGAVRLRFLPFHISSLSHEDDVAVCRSVISRLRHGQDRCELAETSQSSAAVGRLAECDLVLGMRLHAVELALMHGIPVVGLGYDPKVLSVLDRAGLGELGIPIGAITAAEVAGRLEQAAAVFDARREVVRAACRELRELAVSDLRLVTDLLERPYGATRAPGPECAALAGHALRAQFESLGRLRAEHDQRFHELQRAYDVAREQGEVLTRASEDLARTTADLARTTADLARVEGELGRRTGELEQSRAQSERLADELERQRAEAKRLSMQLLAARNDLSAIHTSRLWRLGSRYWRLREIVLGERGQRRDRSLREVPPTPGSSLQSPQGSGDPAGRERALGALEAEATARHDVLFLPIMDGDHRRRRAAEFASRFAAAGHRVFCVDRVFRKDGPPYALQELATRMFEVSLRGPGAEATDDGSGETASGEVIDALNALRLDMALDATALVVQSLDWWPLASRAKDLWAWAVVYDRVNVENASAAAGAGADAEGGDLRVGADRAAGPTAGCLEGPLADKQSRGTLAPGNDWDRQFAAFLQVVKEAFALASVVVVPTAAAEGIPECLDSILRRTAWPHLEILVAENTSGSAADLPKRLELEHPALHAELKERGVVFAPSTNQALSRARGEIIVLLTGDTVVTRGWLSSMMRHLLSDRRIGLLSVVTNETGCEARIEVGYQEVAEMPAWAADHVRAHDGLTRTLPIAPLNCVGLRREVFDRVGPLDDRFEIGMLADDDYSRRVREAGFEIRCADDVFVHRSGSDRLLRDSGPEGLKQFEEARRRYEEKWGGRRRDEGIAMCHRPDLGRFSAQVASVASAVAHARGLVVFLPSVGWNIPLAQRPHHLAREFARQGWVAVFDCSNAYDDVAGFREIESGLYLFRGPAELLHELEPPVLWTFPYNCQLAAEYPASSCRVYDVIDDLSIFPFDRDFLEGNHRRALAESDVVASVARRLHEDLLLHRPDALYLPNGVEYERFASRAEVPEDPDLERLLAFGRPIAGYYGALAEWFDYKLLLAVARRRPDWNFLLIGPMYDDSLRGNPVLRAPNITWLGPRPYESLPGYLATFTVAMIPFVINDITVATSPLKLYEFFAAGKPVISTPMPECAAFEEVAVVRTPQEFDAALDRSRSASADPDYRRRLQARGLEHSWGSRVKTVEQRIAALGIRVRGEGGAGLAGAARAEEAT